MLNGPLHVCNFVLQLITQYPWPCFMYHWFTLILLSVGMVVAILTAHYFTIDDICEWGFWSSLKSVKLYSGDLFPFVFTGADLITSFMASNQTVPHGHIIRPWTTFFQTVSWMDLSSWNLMSSASLQQEWSSKMEQPKSSTLSFWRQGISSGFHSLMNLSWK